ncbi:MAG TPA: hypothetical protein VFR10_08685, partial [bacterium]|nr:hypothetical protein [bacterium]
MGKMRRGMQMKNTGADRGSASSSEELLQYAAMILNQIEERVSRLSQELESFQASGGRQGRDQGREQWSPLRQEWRGSRESGSWEDEDEKQHWSGRGSGRFERNSRYRDEE